MNPGDERYRYPCELSYCVEHEVEVVLKCPHTAALVYALSRFRDDEMRFRVGLMAVLATSDSGEIYIGLNAARGLACLGHAVQEDVERSCPSRAGNMRWAQGDATGAAQADFHCFYPDCPSTFGPAFLLSFERACEAALTFVESGAWPDDMTWAANRYPQS